MKVSYPEFVSRLSKPGKDILNSLTPGECHILHMAIGISGEAGELLDCIKKAVIYRKPIDRENLIEELGDLEFYLQGLRDAYGLYREETLVANVDKLMERYKTLSYSDKQAQERADKQ